MTHTTGLAWLARCRPWQRFCVLYGCGAASALAMAPVHAIPILLMTWPVLITALDHSRTRRAAFGVGWSFGFGFLTAGLYWISASLFVDIAQFWWALPLAVLGLPAALGLFMGAVGWGYRAVVDRLRPGPVVRVVLLALLWSAAEWLRGHVLTGFPWHLLGYAWVPVLPVMQAVAIVGIYGLSLLTAVLAGLPILFLTAGRRVAIISVAIGTIGLAALAGWGSVRLAAAPTAFHEGVTLRLVQPNTPQTIGRTRDDFLGDLDQLRSASVPLDGEPIPSAVIWPETAVPFFISTPGMVPALAAVAPPAGSLLFGMPRRVSDPASPATLTYRNALHAVSQSGLIASYDKVHLVPFGEYVPLADLIPLPAVATGLSDYRPGSARTTLSAAGVPPFSPLVCYEVIFPGAVTGPGLRPDWLLNITNDAWFGQSAGPFQHFAIAQTRAIEEGLPLIRVATSGISGSVDPLGRVLARTPLGEAMTITVDLPTPVPPTLYSRFGDGTYAALFILALTGALAAHRLHHRTHP